MADSRTPTARETNQVPAAPAAAEPPASSQSGRLALIGIFLIMLIAALHLARGIVLPLVLALLLTFAASPLVRWLTRRGIPQIVSAFALVAVLAGLIVGGATLLRAPIADMASQAPEIARMVRDRFEDLSRPFVLLSEASRAITAPSSGAAGQDTVTVITQQPGIIDWLLGTLADGANIIVATLLLAPFLLASIETFKMKLVRALPQLSEKKRSMHVLSEIETRVSRYLLTVSIINAGLGTLIGLAMWALGMPSPLLWGIGAALLNFVPYLGSLTGIALSAAVSLSIHPDLISALPAPLAYLALNSTEGTVITPMIVGRRLSLSPVAIILTLGLTTWMWGFIGTLIGVPLLVVVKTFCDEFPSLAQIGLFISAETVPVEDDAPATAAPASGPIGSPPALVDRTPATKRRR